MYPQPPGTLFIIPILSYYIIFFALFYLFALFSNSKFTLLKLLFIAIFGLIITIPLTMTYFYFTKNVYVTREDEIKNNKVNSIASAKDSIKNTLGPNAKIKIIDDMVIGIIDNDLIEEFTDLTSSENDCSGYETSKCDISSIKKVSKQILKLYPNGIGNITIMVKKISDGLYSQQCSILLSGSPFGSCKKLLENGIKYGSFNQEFDEELPIDFEPDPDEPPIDFEPDPDEPPIDFEPDPDEPPIDFEPDPDEPPIDFEPKKTRVSESGIQERDYMASSNNRNDDEEVYDEEVDDKEVDDEEVDDEEVYDEKVDDEEVYDENVDDEEVDDKKVDDEEVDDEEVDDEEVDDEEVDDDIVPGPRPPKKEVKSALPPHMITAETYDKRCGDETLQEFYEKNSKLLEKCRGDKRWICEDDQWKCPNDEYDCSWGGKYAPIRSRITTMEHCRFGRECGKFGLGGCRKRSIATPSSGFGPVNTSAVDAMENAGKGSFGDKSAPSTYIEESDNDSDLDFEENTNIFDMSGIDKNELKNISLPKDVNIGDPSNLDTADMMKILEVF